MSLPLQKNSKFRQGFYHPKNSDKLIGIDVPVYRSGIELKFFQWLDNTDTVIRWSSEGITVPYYDRIKKKNRTYYVDNYVEIREGEKIKKYLIELKDLRETIKPDRTNRKKKKSTLLAEQVRWENNMDKWKYAKAYAHNHNMDFLVLAHSQKDGFTPVKLDFLL